MAITSTTICSTTESHLQMYRYVNSILIENKKEDKYKLDDRKIIRVKGFKLIFELKWLLNVILHLFDFFFVRILLLNVRVLFMFNSTMRLEPFYI